MDLSEGKMKRSSSCEAISTKQRKIATLAQVEPKMVLTTLAHHIDVDWLAEAYRRTRKSAAAGVDGVTAEDYERDLDKNLSSLLDRFKSGKYRAPAVRRVYIEKPGQPSKRRPIGIPTLEDKVLQRAVLMVLEPIYEQDFLDCSHGFRPRRGAHDAVRVLWQELMDMRGGWVIDLDIQSFFDHVQHGHLRDFLNQRVRDGVIRRMIDKWLKAGIMEDGATRYPEEGAPQGGVISPLLSNLYLHEVLDQWFTTEVQPRLKGRAFLMRYADDAVLVFEREEDARRVMEVLPKRFGRYGLTLHAEKTRLIDFRRPREPKSGPGDRSFDMLGFRHFWARSRKGRWVIKRKTASDRFSRALKRVNLVCRRIRHWPVVEQQRVLNRILRGHNNYYGLIGNSKSISRFRWHTLCLWRKWLNRRSWKTRMNWEKFLRLIQKYPLIPARIPRGHT